MKNMPSEVRSERTELIPIDSVEYHPDNPNEGDVEEIVASIRKHGYIEPIVVQISRRRIIAGEHRHKAAKICDMSHIPAVLVDFSDEEAISYMLASNQTARLAKYNEEVLSSLLLQTKEITGSLEGTGFNDDDLEALLLRTEAIEDEGGPELGAAGSGVSDGQGEAIGDGYVTFKVRVTPEDKGEIEEIVEKAREKGQYDTDGDTLLFLVQRGFTLI